MDFFMNPLVLLSYVILLSQVSKKKSQEANRSDYHECPVSDRLNPHPNVLQIVGLCPSFSLPNYGGIGTTAIISPLQENGSLSSFLEKGPSVLCLC